MFLGILFLFLDITIPLLGGALDLIPDAIGWWLIYADMKDLLVEYPLGRAADENTSLIFAMMVISIVSTVLRLLFGGVFFQVIAAIIEIGSLIFAWMFVGVLDTLEKDYQIPSNGQKIRRATLILTIASPIFLVGEILISGWWLLFGVLWIVYTGAVIYYLYEFYHWDKRKI